MTGLTAVRFLATAGLAYAAASAARIGVADHWFQQQTLAGTVRALRWAPDQASYWTRLALLVSDEDPERAMKALQRAVALNPLDAQAWIELGLRFETMNHLPEAEQALLRAAAADKEYLPAWSLANYYFRRNNPDRFWFWTHQAAEMAYDDLSPLYRLCWKFTSDGAEIESRLGLGSSRLQASYLTYLLAQNRLVDASRFTQARHLKDTPLLLETCERLIEAGQSTEAVAIWNQLAESRVIPYERLTPESGLSLTNGSFSIPPASRGFDWNLPVTLGVSAAREEDPPGIRFSFSGKQPERCDVATQYLPVVEHGRYSLRFLYRTSGLPAGNGLGWRVLTGAGTSLTSGESLSSEPGTQEELSFVVPAQCRLVRLVLGYQRASGTTRIEGFVTLRGLQLVKASTDACRSS